MDWQLVVVFVLVLSASLYLSRQTLRAWRGKAAGCGSCKCSGITAANSSGARTLIPVEQVKLRR